MKFKNKKKKIVKLNSNFLIKMIKKIIRIKERRNKKIQKISGENKNLDFNHRNFYNIIKEKF